MFKIIYLWMIFMIIPVSYDISSAGESDAVLDSLIRTALEQNQDIEAAYSEYQASQYDTKAAGWLPDPTVSVTASNLPYSTLDLDKTPMSGVSIGFLQMIPWPGKLSTQKDIAGINSQNKRVSVVAWRNKVVYEVKSVYYEYAYWSRAEDIINDNILMMESLADITRTRYANGEGLAQDVLSIQTSLSKTRYELVDAINNKKAALAMLNKLTNAPVSMQSDLAATLPLASDDSLEFETLMTTAEANNPLLELSANNVNLAAKNKSLASNDYWPDFSLGFEYRFRKNVPMDAVAGEDFISAKVSLSVPLWFFKNQNNKYKSSSFSLSKARHSLESAQQRVNYELTDAYLQLDRFREGYDLYSYEVIPQAEAALESANIAYQVGKVDFLNLLTAQLRLFEMQLERLRMLKMYNQQLAVLDEIAGVEYGEN